MKKLWFSLTSLVAVLFLVACGQGAAPKEADTEQVKVKVMVVFPKETVEDTIEAEAGESVMEVLSELHDVKEDKGMVTSIGGVSQDEAKQVYWMYKVNGQLAPKGASETLVQDGDEIEFYQETFK